MLRKTKTAFHDLMQNLLYSLFPGIFLVYSTCLTIAVLSLFDKCNDCDGDFSVENSELLIFYECTITLAPSEKSEKNVRKD